MPTQDEQTKISGYRRLSEEEIKLVNSIKETGNRLGEVIASLERNPNIDQRWLAIGKTHLQQGMMATIRSITRPEGF